MENKLSYQMNVFAPTEEIKGRKVLPANTESFSGVIDASVSGSVAPAAPMVIVSNSAKLPHFAPATSDSDNIIGFLEWNVIRNGYVAGTPCQVSPDTNVMYMEAASAINAGAKVAIADFSAVTVKAAAAGAASIGYALESATAAGQLIRVKIKIAPADAGSDLSAYLTKESAAETYQAKLTAGNFVAIDAETNTITTTYSAGNGISIDANGEISAQ